MLLDVLLLAALLVDAELMAAQDMRFGSPKRPQQSAHRSPATCERLLLLSIGALCRNDREIEGSSYAVADGHK